MQKREIIENNIDYTKPIWLHKKYEKFWEITINEMETTIRCGKLIDFVELVDKDGI